MRNQTCIRPLHELMAVQFILTKTMCVSGETQGRYVVKPNRMVIGNTEG